MSAPGDRPSGAAAAFDQPTGRTPDWLPLALKVVLSLLGVLGAYLGGERRGEQAAFPAAVVAAREAVSDQLGTLVSERNDRLPVSVAVHFGRVIEDLERQLRDSQSRECPAEESAP